MQVGAVSFIQRTAPRVCGIAVMKGDALPSKIIKLALKLSRNDLDSLFVYLILVRTPSITRAAVI